VSILTQQGHKVAGWISRTAKRNEHAVQVVAHGVILADAAGARIPTEVVMAAQRVAEDVPKGPAPMRLVSGLLAAQCVAVEQPGHGPEKRAIAISELREALRDVRLPALARFALGNDRVLRYLVDWFVKIMKKGL